MGIQGLIPFLKKASRPANIKDFAGCTVAIDSYCWLHKGAFSCADKLGTGQETTQYVYYCMKYVNYLLSCGIKPIMVFDGCRLPSKKGVEKARQERREVNRKKAKQLLREGKNAEAKEYLQRSIDITPKMALELMKTCRSKGVDCIVAPYEADAQLAYLSNEGIAQVIITEDSDLVLFGCERIMFKMDFAGNGMLVENSKLPMAMDLRPDLYIFDKFRYMCILAGCDYLPSLPGIGLGKACKVFKISRQNDIDMMLRKLPVTLKMSNLTVTAEYIDGFIKANNTFLYQLVFDPMRRKMKPLHPYPPEIKPEELGYAGQPFPEEKAYQMALGNIDLYTGERIADFDPDVQTKSNSWDHNKRQAHQLSIWDKNYKPGKFSGPSQKPVQPNNTTSMKNKEVTVKVNLPKIVKPAPVVQDVVSNHELLELYNEWENVEPAAKRPKLECEESERKCPKKSPRKSPRKASKPKLSLDELEMEPLKVTTHDSARVTPTRSPLKSPNRENILDDVRDMKDHATPPVNKDKKTPKNVFAKNANAKREKFQLNASKTSCIESRFFKSAEPLRKTAFGEALEEELAENCIKTEEQDDKEYEDKLESPVKNPGKSPQGNGAHKPSEKLSLKQVFGFRRLDTPSLVLSSSSPRTSNPFKPVISPQNAVKSPDCLLKKNSSNSQLSNAPDVMCDASDSSYIEGDSFTSATPLDTRSPLSQTLKRSSCSPLSQTFKRSSNQLKLKQKPGNLQNKCMDIASMFRRVPKKTFQYSAQNNRTAEPSPTPDLPSLPD